MQLVGELRHPAIETRTAALAAADQDFMRAALRYIYLLGASHNSPLAVRIPGHTSEQRKARKDGLRELLRQHLGPAERQAFNNLTKFAHSSRARYGPNAVREARDAGYCCRDCGMPDVRTLEMDHVNGIDDTKNFRLLCANCHNIKSRKKEWKYIVPVTPTPA
jgi:5-methylcytosine-specific restriction endonuclease McrA